MNKQKLIQLREAISDRMDVYALVEVLDLDTQDILDMIDNETLIDHLEDLEDHIPSFFEGE